MSEPDYYQLIGLLDVIVWKLKIRSNLVLLAHLKPFNVVLTPFSVVLTPFSAVLRPLNAV